MSRISRTFQELLNEREQYTDFSILNDQKATLLSSDEKNLNNDKSAKNILGSNFQYTKLSVMFFSSQNINSIQNVMRYRVFKETNFKIGRQSEINLKIIMRSIFLQYSKNLDYNFKEQLQRLNDIVFDEVVPKLVNEVTQYLLYLRDRTNGYVLNTLPISVSSAGTKQDELFSGLGI